MCIFIYIFISFDMYFKCTTCDNYMKLNESEYWTK